METKIELTFQINDGNDGHNPCLGRLNAVPDNLAIMFPDAVAGAYLSRSAACSFDGCAVYVGAAYDGAAYVGAVYVGAVNPAAV